MGALSPDEHGYDGITELAGEVQPLCHHGQHPTMEIVWPSLKTGRHTPCQITDMVGLAIPRATTAKIVEYRTVIRYEGTAHIKLHVTLGSGESV